MRASHTQRGRWIRLLAVVFVVLWSVGLFARAENKEEKEEKKAPSHATQPAKPAAPANKATTGGPVKPNVAGPKNAGLNPALRQTTNANTGRQTNIGFAARPAPVGSRQTQLRSGRALQMRANGRISDVHDARRGMDIHHNLNGSRRVSVVRADHTTIVVERGRPGYIQRPFVYGGRQFAARSYYFNGHVYQRFYVGYTYHGVFLNVYAPVRFYPVAFYGWAYRPWVVPVVYPWGWVGTPWFGFYGFYFTPYPVYAAPALWLTDYLIASELQAAYIAQQQAQAQAAMQAPPEGAVALTPEVKQAIADEVRAQIEQENAQAQQNAANQDIDPASAGIGGMLADGHSHVFVVGNALDVVDSFGGECSLSDGDALKLVAPPASTATEANLVVLASKVGMECRKSAVVTVSLADLQEMQNHMREVIDQGLQQLQENQGKSGLPAAPPPAVTAQVNAGFAQSAPPPDPNGVAEINQQLKEADVAEQDVALQAQVETPAVPAPPTAVPAPTQTITLGQSINEVTAILGPPVTIVDLGPKKIYKYKDLKVSFKDGKVSDVQ